MSDIKKNYEEVLASLKPGTKLLAVTKNQTEKAIRELYSLGQRDFGENKVQELSDKAHKLSDLTDINWHFIGHLQTNKINTLLNISQLKYIHSVDRMALLEKLLKKEPLQKIKIFIQVNTSGEVEKGGFSTLKEINEALAMCEKHNFFEVCGLMTMGKIRTDNFENDAHKSFAQLKEHRDALNSQLELSMGMSSDYKIAMDYDAKWVRIGSTLFRL